MKSKPEVNQAKQDEEGMGWELEAVRASNRSILRVPREAVFTTRETHASRMLAIFFRFISLFWLEEYGILPSQENSPQNRTHGFAPVAEQA